MVFGIIGSGNKQGSAQIRAVLGGVFLSKREYRLSCRLFQRHSDSLRWRKKNSRRNATQLDEAELGVTPKALDPVDVVLAADELVFVVMNAPVFVTTQEPAVVAEPPIGVDGGLGKHLSLDDRLQLCPRTVFDHPGEDLPPRLRSPITGVLPPAPRPRRPRTRRGPK